MTSATTVPLHSLLKDFPNLFMPGLSLSLHSNPLKMFDINQVKIPSPEYYVNAYYLTKQPEYVLSKSRERLQFTL